MSRAVDSRRPAPASVAFSQRGVSTTPLCPCAILARMSAVGSMPVSLMPSSPVTRLATSSP